MVYFTCGTCGEQVKKPQVEKHYTQKCRKCTMLTCIDCLKDFYGDEYKAHNQCMSESQRYSKEGRDGWDPAVGQGNKGEKKQIEWIGKLRQLLETADDIDPAVRNIVNTILNHENIPRKKPKFMNFVKNIMRHTKAYDVEKTWDLFSQALIPSKEEESKSEDLSTNEDSQDGPNPKEETKDEPKDTGEKKMTKKEKKKRKNQPEPEPEAEPVKSKKEKKGEKRKLEETMDVDQDESSEPAEKKTKFDWDETITSILSKKGEEMKLNKLKKKCVAEYFSQNSGTHWSEEEIGAKFDKKIKKRTYRVLKDKVRLANPDAKEDGGAEQSNGGAEPANGGAEQANGGADKLSFNQWEASSLGNDAQTEKFRRLMGIKTSKPPQALAAGGSRDDKKMFRDLEDGFEKARNTHFKAKGMGLGFS